MVVKTAFVENLHHRPLERPSFDAAALAWELGFDVSAAMGQVIIWETQLTQTQLAALYCSVDAFVLATHGEGWGLPLLEAMASGLPTLATAWSGACMLITQLKHSLCDIVPAS